MGVAKCTTSRIPSTEFPDITKARRVPACGAKKTAPVWDEEKEQSPVEKQVFFAYRLIDCMFALGEATV